MIQDVLFWKEELEDKCMLVITKTRNLSSQISGDAPIADGGGATGAEITRKKRQHDSHITETFDPRKRGGTPGDFRQHNVNSDGLLATNRRGISLCDGFQKGECNDTDHNERCLKNSNMVHQCAKCLSKTHGAHACPVQDVARAPGSNNFSNNTNTGKGKGKGKKGKKGSSKGWRY